MDPDATLIQIKEHIEDLDLDSIEESGSVSLEELNSMVECIRDVGNLLDWIDRGGFLPSEWQ